ncbi:MAG: hypothetical protein ACK41T_02275 [Pseudobdellovibrio sp.]
MYKKISPYIQYNMSLWLLVAILLTYSLGITVYAIKNQRELKIIAIDQFGTRLVTEQNDKIFEQEKYEFVKYFIRLYTNYDSENFTQTIGHSTDLMSDDVWSKIEAEYKSLKNRVQETKMHQISEITRLEMDDKNPNVFKAQIESTQSYRGIQKKVKGEIQLTLIKKDRSELNPHGWEVVGLFERWE